MFLPFADMGMPMIMLASGMCFRRLAAVPIRYIMRLSTFSKLAVLTAEPKAMPKSRSLNMQLGPTKSWPNRLGALPNSLQFL